MSLSKSEAIKLIGALAGAVLSLSILVQGFYFLRGTELPRLLVAGIAILGFTAAMVILYLATDVILRNLPSHWSSRLQPLPFIAPGVVMVAYFVAIPMVRTFYASLFNRDGSVFIGLANYISVFTEPFMLVTFRNNLLWLVFGAGFTVIFGLLVAALADRSRFEKTAKAIIFMPMAVSLVGAGIIWKFIYAFKEASEPQIGILNAVVAIFGGEPEAWIQLIQPWNNLFLIVIVIWLQTGYAMVLFSAAIKSVPSDMIEAAQLDGANDLQIFFTIIMPYIRPTLIAVTATVVIFTLKIFDIVLVMTGGQFGTDVIATQFYNQYFINRNAGLGSAIAIVLLVAVAPVIVYNLRHLNNNEPL